MGIMPKLMGYGVKAVIFRENAPPIIDWAKRLKNRDKYGLMKEKRNLPCPPSRNHIFKIGKALTIFLYSPRKGTYIYLSKPHITYDQKNDKLDIKYNANKIIPKPPEKGTPVKIEDGKPIKADDANAYEASFQLMDYDEINFLAQDIIETKDKYDEKTGFWEKHGNTILNITFMLGMAIALWITYEQIVFEAAAHAIRPTTTCICNITSGAL